MQGNTPLPLPLSPNGVTLRGLDLRTDLCYCSFSVCVFFVQWAGWVSVQVCRFVRLVPFDYVTAGHLIGWDRWVLLPLGFVVLRVDLSLLGIELHPSTPSFQPCQQSQWSSSSLSCLMPCT